MKQRLEIRQRFLLTAFICSLYVLAQGCVKDITTDVVPQDNRIGLQLNILVPTDVATRSSATSEDELLIMKGYIIVFNPDNTYATHEEINIDKISRNKTATPTIYSEIPNDEFVGKRVVLILNHQNEVSDFTGMIYGDASFNDKFIIGKGHNNTDVDSPKDDPIFGIHQLVNGIPMYGEMAIWNATGTNTISVTRSVAKVLVQINTAIGGDINHNTDFNTTNVTYGIYNITPGGYIKTSADPLTTLNAGTNSAFRGELLDLNDGLNNKTSDVTQATAASLGASYIYEYPYSKRIIGQYSEINYPENPTETHVDRLAIILKVTGTNPRFYRLDLAKQDANGTPMYIDVKRNHQYRIVIKAVNDEGYSSADKALKGLPSNIQFDLVDDIGHVTVSNGSYAISVGEEQYADNSATPYPAFTGKATTIENVASDVCYIFNRGLPFVDFTENSITVVDANNEPITSATVSSTALTEVRKNLRVIIPESSIEGDFTFYLKYKLDKLEYISCPITINRTEPPIFNVGDPYPYGATVANGDIIGIVWRVNNLDGTPNMNKDATGTSGSILAMDFEPGTYAWATSTGSGSTVASEKDLFMETNVPDFLINGKACQDYITDYLNGDITTQKYSEAVPNKGHVKSDYPAYQACMDKNTTGINTGWYLPAQEQLHMKVPNDPIDEKYPNLGTSVSSIYYEFKDEFKERSGLLLKKGMENYGATLIATGHSDTDKVLWSASAGKAEISVSNATHAWRVAFDNGHMDVAAKKDSHKVRCIKDF